MSLASRFRDTAVTARALGEFLPAVLRSGILGLGGGPGQVSALGRYWFTTAREVEQGHLATPHRIALIDDDGELTYRQLRENSRSVARHLVGLGLNEIRLGVMARNGRGMIYPLAAKGYAGAGIYLLNVGSSPEQLTGCIEENGINVLVIDDEFLDRLDPAIVEKQGVHVIIGDANLCEVAGYLKLGMTSLVLGLIEDGAMPDLTVHDPVRTLHAVSHDPTLATLITLADGTRLTAVDLQRRLHEAAAAHVEDRFGTDTDPQTRDVLDRWGDLLDRLADDPMRCARELDWVAKLRVLEGFRQREGLDWDHLRLQAIDLQYADVRSSYPSELTGRALSLFTMALFLGVALMQWFTGIVATWAAGLGIEPYLAVMLTIALWLGAASFGFRWLPASALLQPRRA